MLNQPVQNQTEQEPIQN